MHKSLCDFIFASIKRKQVLLLLQDGAKEMEAILKSLDTTRQALLPQMKVLEEHYLVNHYDDTYELTIIGKLIVEGMAPLVNKIETFDSSIEYFGTHKLNCIPLHLLQMIDELGKCELIKPSLTNIYEYDKYFFETCKESKCVYHITTVLHPDAFEIIADSINSNINVYIIATLEIHNKILEEKKTEHEKIIQSDLVHIFVYPKKIDFQFISFSKSCMMLSLLKTDGEPDINYVMCSSETIFKWGKDLFDFYLKDSIPITEL
jgi:predicted transcriptional regulator